MYGYTLLAHNGSGFDSHYLFRYLRSDFGFDVQPLYQGSRLLQFLVKSAAKDRDYVLRAIDTAQFFQSRLEDLPKQFGLDGLDLKKGFFPYKFDSPDRWNYAGEFPGLEWYGVPEMSVKKAAEVRAWHSEQLGSVFHFRKEMTDYCLEDVRVLLSAVQRSIKEDLELMSFDGFAECCTIASKTLLFFRHAFLRPNTIGVIGQQGYGGPRNQSREGLLWLLLQERVYPGMQHALSTRGEAKLLGVPVDGFHAPSNTVLQFHGCFWHGCVRCYPNRTLKNTVNGKSFDELFLKTQQRTAQLRAHGYTVVEKWACQFTDGEKQQAADFGLVKKVPQLVPKDGFFGGRTEAINMRASLCEADMAEGHSILYYDVTSEYPFVNARKSYPLGHPKILLQHQCPQSNEEWAGRELFGMAKCTLLPPGRLFHPVLPYRAHGALMFPLCRTCCETRYEGHCEHSANARALHGKYVFALKFDHIFKKTFFVVSGTWTTLEIDCAITLGYVIMGVEEVWHFERRHQELFTPFIMALYKGKIEASGYPADVVSPEAKQAFRDTIKAKEGIELEPDKISKNPGRRQVCKILLNSAWGKFGQRENLSQTEFIRTADRLNALLFSDLYTVQTVEPIDDSTAYVVYKDVVAKPNPKGNIFIAAFTTAHARLHLYKDLVKLDERALYCDTDSIVFTHKTGEYTPQLGNFLGEWTDEVAPGERIVEFTTCGPKNYSYHTVNSRGKTPPVFLT